VHCPGVDVESHRLPTQQPVDAEIVVMSELGLLGRPLSGEDLLRERRSVVRLVVLRADHRHRVGPSFAA
jgi:hypothetical protein